jgi:hypothetical protein
VKLPADLTKTRHLPFVHETVLSWLQTACPLHRGQSRNTKLLGYLFFRRGCLGLGRDNQSAFFCNSTIFARARKDFETSPPSGAIPPHYIPVWQRQGLAGRPNVGSFRRPFWEVSSAEAEIKYYGEGLSPPILCHEERQMSAKLHTLRGVPIEYLRRRAELKLVYPYACSVVYDLRNYTQANKWGPYKDDGLCTVDWERMEAIMIVVGHNLRMFIESNRVVFPTMWESPWVGAIPDSFHPSILVAEPRLTQQPAPPLEMMDVSKLSSFWSIFQSSSKRRARDLCSAGFAALRSPQNPLCYLFFPLKHMLTLGFCSHIMWEEPGCELFAS